MPHSRCQMIRRSRAASLDVRMHGGVVEVVGRTTHQMRSNGLRCECLHRSVLSLRIATSLVSSQSLSYYFMT
jgi:hypothetical protein